MNASSSEPAQSVPEIDETMTSKLQIFLEKNKEGFVLFEKDKWPKLLGSNYDVVLFTVANVAFKLRNDVTGLYRLLEPFVELDMDKDIFVFEDVKAEELRSSLVQQKALRGLEVFELIPKTASDEHIPLLQSMGCNMNALKVSAVNAPVSLKNQAELVMGKFDITFSNWLLHDDSGIADQQRSNVFRAMEMYALFANLTEPGGYSIHTFGSYISTLYDTYLDFLGFRIVKYFRAASGPYGFVVIMQKYNNKEISYDEFTYLYQMLQARNPTRYR